jgi:hypothetical protein
MKKSTENKNKEHKTKNNKPPLKPSKSCSLPTLPNMRVCSVCGSKFQEYNGVGAW